MIYDSNERVNGAMSAEMLKSHLVTESADASKCSLRDHIDQVSSSGDWDAWLAINNVGNSSSNSKSLACQPAHKHDLEATLSNTGPVCLPYHPPHLPASSESGSQSGS